MAEDPDFGKVKNDNPAEEFAFEVSHAPSILAVSRLTQEEAIQQIVAEDDFGVPVTDVPMGQTSHTVFIDFCPRSLALPTEQDVIPVGAFIWQIADAIAHEMCPNADAFDFVCAPEEVLASRFERFYYRRNPNADWWSMSFAE